MANGQQDLVQRIDKLEATMAQLEEREKQSAFQFFVQYLLSPLLLVALGAVMNWRVEKAKADIESKKVETERIDLAQKMIPTLFGGKPEQAFATERLMAKVVEPGVAKEFEDIVAKFYKLQIESDAKAGNFENVEKTVSAAKALGGGAADQVVQSVKPHSDTANKLQNYSVASQEERAGFESLVAGRYDGALQHFQNAEKAYNGYHYVYEIAQLLRSKKTDFANPETRKQLLAKILTNYSYQAPPDLLEQLKTLARK